MATLMLGTVFEQTKRKFQLKLLAGEGGLHRSLRWLYFSEDIGNAEFLRGGELMVLTGFSLQDKAEFESFIRMLIRKNSCGVIVNVGKYLFEEDISQELRDLCDAQQFPLIIMPWKYHLTDILQDYSRQIFFRTHEQDNLTYIFQMLITDGKLYNEEEETRLIANQFDPEGYYCVAVVSCQGGGKAKLPADLSRDMHVLAENHINQSEERVCMFSYQNQLVLVFHEAEPRQMEARLEHILQLCRGAFPKLQFFSGIGSALQSILQLKESYGRAAAALELGMIQGKPRLSFEEMGIFQLFFTCTDKAVLQQYTKVLTPLECYDAQYGGQLVDTLRLYLKFNGSVILVSDEMYCHRNTTNYRIKKIKFLLHSDLDNREILFQVQMAFYVRDYQRIYQLEG